MRQTSIAPAGRHKAEVRRRVTAQRRDGGRSRAFTLIELLVVIAIIALLVSILLPSLSMAKELARDIVCRSHLKHIATCHAMYAESNNEYVAGVYAGYGDDQVNEDHRGRLAWYQLLGPYAAKATDKIHDYDVGLFEGCPNWKPRMFRGVELEAWNTGYGQQHWLVGHIGSDTMSSPYRLTAFDMDIPEGSWVRAWCDRSRFFRLTEFSHPMKCGWNADSTDWHVASGNSDVYDPLNNQYPYYASWAGKDPERHMGDRCNVSFVDAHVESLDSHTSGKAFWDPDLMP
jgi:prepilin-type N-terminal cleavage/methylation domain-containing protein/prepilin-type processing-associated H-X9-DG protein